MQVNNVSDQRRENRKQSIIAGGLISSAGIFVSKFIGLFYAIPFNLMLGSDANLNYYGVAFNIYTYLLNISMAGFPFAVATLVAKYSARGDFKTTLLIKKLSISCMAVFGFGMMMIVILFATPLARLVVPEDGEGIAIMRNVLIIISLALFFVPVLSSIRGFYQGLKEMELYALSQVLEQISRVTFLLGLSSLAVYGLGYDHVWAVYFGVLSTSVSAILAIIHIKFYDRKRMKGIKKLAHSQQVVANDNRKQILSELLLIALPYLAVSILGYSDTIVNTVFLKNGLEVFGYTSDQVIAVSQSINYGVNKLIAIPMILAPGFSAAILPHIVSALSNKDFKLIRKNICNCIESVLYIGLCLSFCLFIYARPLYTILFPNDNLDISVEVLQWYSMEAFLSTVAPIFTSLMMAIGLRKIKIRCSVIIVTIKLLITYPMICAFGFQGAIISSAITMVCFIAVDAYLLSKRFRVNWQYTLRRFVLMCVSLSGVVVVAFVFNAIGVKGYGNGTMRSILELGLSGGCAVLAYFAISYMFGLPQLIFHLDLKKICNKVMKRGKRT